VSRPPKWKRSGGQTADRLLAQVRQALSRPITLPHQAATVGVQLFLLAEVHDLAADPVVMDLMATFPSRAAGRRFDRRARTSA